MARKFYTPIDLTGLELSNFKIQNLASDPTAFGAGHAYFNTTHDELRVYDGSAWQPVGGSIEQGTFSSRPSAGNAGRVYAATDTQTLYVDTGSAWVQIGDAYGAAADAQAAAEDYADSLAANYDAAGAAAQALLDAQDYADGLASNYDPAGAAATAETNAKAYADAISQGLDVKASVRAATTGNITLSSTQTVDGVSLSVGDRVLVKAQSTASANGIYVVASGSWTRAVDANADTEVTKGLFTFVEEGTTLAGTGWVLTAKTGVLDTGNLTFTQFSGAGTYVAGNGIELTGNSIAAKPASSGGIVVDGSGISVDTTLVARKYSTNIGNGSATSIAVTHNLGTYDVAVTVYDNSSKDVVFCDVTHNSTNQVTLSFAVAPTSNEFRVVVVG